ncbi:hypothetical protein OUZ56_012235 [Daphnia magna]|uniref:Uncharacterized protein n=1 Tax=Daphnia magna TaxID=35525 RepID=A0ABQ9Z2G1_9CRUS|nr:hypothetical protein OUZ56_012235 [Daphnia magna]
MLRARDMVSLLGSQDLREPTTRESTDPSGTVTSIMIAGFVNVCNDVRSHSGGVNCPIDETGGRAPPLPETKQPKVPRVEQ